MFANEKPSKELCMASLIAKDLGTYLGNGKLVAPKLYPVWDGLEYAVGELAEAFYAYGKCANSEVIILRQKLT